MGISIWSSPLKYSEFDGDVIMVFNQKRLNRRSGTTMSRRKYEKRVRNRQALYIKRRRK